MAWLQEICFGVFGLTYRLQAGLGSVVLNSAKDFLYEQINADKKYCGSNKTPGAPVQSWKFSCMLVRGFVSRSGFGSASAPLCSWKPKSSQSHWMSDMTEWSLHSVFSAQEWSFFQATNVLFFLFCNSVTIKFPNIVWPYVCLYVCMFMQASN